jgi:DNA-binding LacI/PurR family transcriptional regulator
MPSTKKRVTNKDVARLAGVSTAVVSYVINDGPRQTSPEIRERVLEAVKALDYHPNALARGLRGQRSHTIGFVVNDYFPLRVFISPYSAGLLTGLVDQLKQQHYHLLVYPIEIGEDLASFEQLVRSGRLDGLAIRLIGESVAGDKMLHIIETTRIPCVCIERSASSRFSFPSVTIDEITGAEQAMAYLVAHGHQRIAHIHGDLRYASAQSRLEGYKRMLKAHDLPIEDSLIRGNSWSSADAARATREFLALDTPPTAIFAASDDLAISAVNVLSLQGRRVPDDMAVIGYDDSPLAAEMIPGLTTVRIPIVNVGRKAADLLLHQLDYPDEPRGSIVMQTELIQRNTV